MTATTIAPGSSDLVARAPMASEETQSVARRDVWRNHYRAALALSDLVMCLVAIAGAVGISGIVSGTNVSGPHYGHVLALAVPSWLLTLAASGAYDLRVLGIGSDEFKRVTNAAVRFAAGMASLSFVTHLALARSVAMPAVALAMFLTGCSRFAARRVLHRVRAKGFACERVLVVGSGEHAVNLVRQLRDAPHVGLEVLGVCMPGGRREDCLATDLDVPVLGSIGNIRMAVQRAQATTVAVAHSPGITPSVLRSLVWELEDLDVDVVVAPGLTDVAGPRIHIRPVPGVPLLHVEQPQFSGWGRVLKGLVDRAASAFMLTLLAPVLAMIAIAVRLDSKGPALFRQERIGRDGRSFTVFKFRSMQVTAEAQLEHIIDLNERSEGLLFKMREDPRVTRVGKFLRRFSLDELPQLINVLLGHMSLVGPRPPLPREVQRYDGTVQRRLLVKPGLTGLWQVNGRSDLDWDSGLRLDLYYVENWSPALDFMILWKTLFAVLQARGAY